MFPIMLLCILNLPYLLNPLHLLNFLNLLKVL